MVAHALETSGCRGPAPGRARAWTSSPEPRRRRRPSQAPAAPCVHECAACPCICAPRPDDAAAPVARAGTDDAAAPSHRPPCDCGAVKPVCARAAHCGTPRATRSCTTPSSNLVRSLVQICRCREGQRARPATPTRGAVSLTRSTAASHHHGDRKTADASCTHIGHPLGGPGPVRICCNTNLKHCLGTVECADPRTDEPSCTRLGHPLGGPGPGRICCNANLKHCLGKVECAASNTVDTNRARVPETAKPCQKRPGQH